MMPAAPARSFARPLAAALALLLVAAIPARATTPPSFTVVDVNPLGDSYALDSSNAVAMGDYVYFAADDGTHGRELWRSNGTTTELVADLNAGGDANPRDLYAYDGYVYFTGDDGTSGRELFRSDGDTIELVKDINTGSSDARPLGDFDGNLYFYAYDDTHGVELWRTNGTAAGTVMVDDINPTGDAWPSELVVFDGYLYFSATDGADHGYELWRTDGTGADLVKDIRPSGDSTPMYLTVYDDHLYFSANDGTNGNELWRSDGTEAGTELAFDMRTGPGDGDPTGLVTDGRYLFYTAGDDPYGRELWVTNGDSYSMAHDIEFGSSGSNPRKKAMVGIWVYSEACTTADGCEPWRSNAVTSEPLADINVGDDSYPESFVAVGDWVYFTAHNGTARQVWRTNGSTTEVVPFPVAGQSVSCDCFATNLIAVGGRLFSTLYSDELGYEFAWLDEPTYGLPETNAEAGLSGWTIAFAVLSFAMLAAGVGLRQGGARRKR